MIGFLKSIQDTFMGRIYTHESLVKESKEFAFDHVSVIHQDGCSYITFNKYRICEFKIDGVHYQDSLEAARENVANDYYQQHSHLLKHNDCYGE